MKYTIKINKISTVYDLDNSWNSNDYKQLLELFDFENNDVNDLSELRDLLFMAISDNEPSEAAEIILKYKLSNELNDRQISTISHEMLTAKISEEYARIDLHKTLFIINQLLFKAFNGKFPNTKATIINFDILPVGNAKKDITKEIVIKCFAQNLDSHSIVLRLFGKQLKAEEEFDEANDVIWFLEKLEDGYQLITSDYFINKEDLLDDEFEATIKFFEEH